MAKTIDKTGIFMKLFSEKSEVMDKIKNINAMDAFHMTMGPAGMLPEPLGISADLIDMSAYALEGDWKGAGLSFGASIPGAGIYYGGLKNIRKAKMMEDTTLGQKLSKTEKRDINLRNPVKGKDYVEEIVPTTGIRDIKNAHQTRASSELPNWDIFQGQSKWGSYSGGSPVIGIQGGSVAKHFKFDIGKNSYVGDQLGRRLSDLHSSGYGDLTAKDVKKLLNYFDEYGKKVAKKMDDDMFQFKGLSDDAFTEAVLKRPELSKVSEVKFDKVFKEVEEELQEKYGDVVKKYLRLDDAWSESGNIKTFSNKDLPNFKGDIELNTGKVIFDYMDWTNP